MHQDVVAGVIRHFRRHIRVRRKAATDDVAVASFSQNPGIFFNGSVNSFALSPSGSLTPMPQSLSIIADAPAVAGKPIALISFTQSVGTEVVKVAGVDTTALFGSINLNDRNGSLVHSTIPDAATIVVAPKTAASELQTPDHYSFTFNVKSGFAMGKDEKLTAKFVKLLRVFVEGEQARQETPERIVTSDYHGVED